MAQDSPIEWTDATWNPVTGCDRVSPGCDNCYALTFAARLKAMGQPRYQRDGDPRTSGPGFAVACHRDALDEPLRWRRPRVVFTPSMGDLFHPAVPDGFVADVIATVASAPRHTFLVLTKRAARMRALVSCPSFWSQVAARARGRGGDADSAAPGVANLWLGVSAEDAARVDERVPLLLDTPAAVRFVSAEPLLGDVAASLLADSGGGPRVAALDWVIVGGESGPSARAPQPSWVRAIRDVCQVHGTAFHFKQWGGRTPGAGGRVLDGRTWDERPAVIAPSAR